MATVASTLERVKQDLHRYLPITLIEQACKDAGHHWRKRKFDPVTTLQLFVLQILWCNTAITHLRHLAQRPINAAAYCKARMRLPLAALQRLLEHSAEAIFGVSGQNLWCGLRTYLVDATCALAPDTPNNQRSFPQPKGQKRGCGFPVPKLLGLFDAASGVIVRVLFTPLYCHDLPGMIGLHSALGAGDLVVGDRAFCSYAHLAVLRARQVLALFRLHASRTASFERHRRGKRHQRRRSQGRQWHGQLVQRLGPGDQLVRWTKPGEGTRPKWLSLAQYRTLPQELLIRELRFVIPGHGGRTRVVTVATTLLDPELYPKRQIAELYGVRWTIETHFAELKTTLKMRRIKCQTAVGAQKEMVVYCLVYNLTRALMLEAAQRQKVAPNRISFIDTLRWMLTARPGEALPILLTKPRRKDRHQPRVVKDRHDGYQRMTRPRAVMNRHPEKWPGRK
jgi:hypothetical protein